MDDDVCSMQDCCQLAFHGRAEPAAKYWGGSIACSPQGFQTLLLSKGVTKSSATLSDTRHLVCHVLY